MDSSDSTGAIDHDTWLLETFRAVARAVAVASDGTQLGREIPDALTEQSGNRVAWIGTRRPGTDRIEIRSSSPSLPAEIELPDGDQSVTQTAAANGEVMIRRAEDVPEYRRLREVADIPRVRTAVTIPLADPETIGVVHLYHDTGISDDADTRPFAELGDLITTGFRTHEYRRQRDHERERLEGLRSLVSHDLGNPLNLAAGRLEIARDELESEHLDHVKKGLGEIDSLADEGLTFVRAGRKIKERAPVELEAIADDCWETSGDERGHLSVVPVTIYGESERLRMILNQLFENALVHNGGEVTVTVGPLDGRGFYVEDDGRGIPEDERELVFDRGYTTASDRDGHGLALVDEIANAHGWSVGLGDAEGTRIEIETGRW